MCTAIMSMTPLSYVKIPVGIPYLVSVANNAHRAIQFTYEKEDANHIPFLGMSLRRQNDGNLSRSVYRKASWTGQYVNFSSFVPMVQKRNLVKNLVFRAKISARMIH